MPTSASSVFVAGFLDPVLMTVVIGTIAVGLIVDALALTAWLRRRP